MLRKRLAERHTPGKENVADPVVKEAQARDKLHTLSQNVDSLADQQLKV